MTNTISIGAIVKQHRKSAGLSQEDLADAAGVSRKMIMSVESESTGGETASLSRVLCVLGITAPLITSPVLRATLIKTARKKASLDQVGLSELSNTSLKVISKAENAAQNIRILQLASIVGVLGLPMFEANPKDVSSE